MRLGITGLGISGSGVVRPELLLDTDFQTGGPWVEGTGWTTGGGSAVKVAGTGSNLSQTVYTAPDDFVGKTVRFVITLTVSAGGLLISPGGYQVSASITTSGTHTVDVTAVNALSDGIVYLIADAVFAGTITRISAKLL